jgi:hypothetical protein
LPTVQASNLCPFEILKTRDPAKILAELDRRDEAEFWVEFAGSKSTEKKRFSSRYCLQPLKPALEFAALTAAAESRALSKQGLGGFLGIVRFLPQISTYGSFN